MPDNVVQFLKTYLEMPADFWVKILIAGVFLFLLFVVLRKLAFAGQVIVSVVVFLAIGVIGFKWVRYRGEPAFMTPVVEFVAAFFPKKPAETAAPATPKAPSTPAPAPAKTPSK